MFSVCLRVGRTARAGKTGRSVAFVTQYDVEAYQRLEALIGQKLPEYPADEATVLVLLERVSEAQRLAARELREMQASEGSKGKGKGKKRGGAGGAEADNDDMQDGDRGGDGVKDAMSEARGKKTGQGHKVGARKRSKL